MEFKRYNSFEDLKPYQQEWNHLVEKSASHVPFLTFQYQQAWWQTRGGGEWPESSELVLIAAFEGDELVGVAPLFHAENLLGKQALLFVGSIEVSDFLDLIVWPAQIADFVSGLLDYLVTAEGLPAWEMLDLYNILEESPSLTALQQEADQRGWAHKQKRLQPSPYIPLPGDYEAYLAGIDKKQRHEIRRKLRNVEQSLAEGALTFAEDGEQLHDEIEAFIEMMAQDPNKHDFLTEKMKEHLHNTARVAFDSGWLNMAFFTLDGQKAAGHFSIKYNDRLWCYNSGWKWEFRDYSPGWVLVATLLQWANENGIKEFDFMRGDEPYKYKFGGIDRFIYRVTLSPQ